MALNDRFANLSTSSLGQAVRVSIPAGLAHDFDAMQRVTKQVLGQLGCEGCHSGFDIRFEVLRDFIADEKANVRPAGLQTAGQPG